MESIKGNGSQDTASIRFTPLSGVDADSPLCYLLDVDGFLILLDCGIDELLDVTPLEALRPYAGQVKAVLISHSDLGHLGGLPYAVAKLGLNCPVFSTIPTYKMGQMFCYDAFQARTSAVDFQSFSLDDVDAAFELFSQLKYSQHASLADGRIQITPYPAGRTLGGSLWRIVKDTEEIVYAVDFNHKSERHLASAAIDQFRRPSLLITDAFNALTPLSSKRTREAELTEEIVKALKGDGNVLIPVDTAGRVLELLLFLDQLWSAKDVLRPFSLVFMTNISVNTLEFARSMLEWMSDAIMETFHRRKSNPFSFENVRLCHDRDELADVSRPMVVLASSGSLDSGFARDLFIELSADARNRIIFPDRAPSHTLARKVMTTPIPCKVPVRIETRLPLAGAELEEWKVLKRAQMEAERALLEVPLFSSLIADDTSGGPSEGGAATGDDHDDGAEGTDAADLLAGADDIADDEDDEDALDDNVGYSMDTRSFFEEGTHDLFITPDIENRAMFPCPPSPPDFDEYGEFFDPDELRPADAFLGPAVAVDDPASSLADDVQLKVEDAESAGDGAAVDEFGGEKPMKYIVQERVLEVNSRIRYIEFEGRSDDRSIKNIIQGISPRKLILVHGSPDAIESLAQHTREHIRACESVVPTKLGECSLITFQTSTFSVLVDDVTFSSLRFIKCGDYELSYIDASRESPHAISADLQSAASTSAGAPIPSLKPIARHQIRPHRQAFIGNLKLSDFKGVLSRAGFQAEFMGSGTEKALVVNGRVFLRKPPTSTQITIEGTICDEYYQVRDLLYAQYTVV